MIYQKPADAQGPFVVDKPDEGGTMSTVIRTFPIWKHVRRGPKLLTSGDFL